MNMSTSNRIIYYSISSEDLKSILEAYLPHSMSFLERIAHVF